MYYLDTSALAKLVMDEVESDSLRARVGDDTVTSSVLALTELRRAARRAGAAREAQTIDVLARVDLVELSHRVLDVAATLLPVQLRSLDAIHVASALEIAANIGSVITYDARMAEAARLAGLPVESPGR